MTRRPHPVLTPLRALLSRRLTLTVDEIPYRFENLPLGKVVNWIVTETCLRVQPQRAWGMPTRIQVEPTTSCNLRCPVCPVTTGMDRGGRHMSLELFTSIVDQLGGSLLLMVLWDWGEPFLNPHIYEMIVRARSRGIRVVSSTNGHVFARGDHAEKLVRASLDSIIFAVDGINQETYQRYRANGRLEVVLEGIRRVVQAKRKLGAARPLINLRFLAMAHNEHEVEHLPEFARSLGVDAVTAKTLNPYCGGTEDSDAEGEALLPSGRALCRFKVGERSEGRRRLRRNPCRNLWFQPTIHADGVVSMCTFDPQEQYVLGDASQTPFCEIWNGSAYQGLRRRFRRDSQDIPLCADCTCAFEGGVLGTQTIASARLLSADARSPSP